MIFHGLKNNLIGNTMEKNTDSISWLHGLEDYFRFKQSNEVFRCTSSHELFCRHTQRNTNLGWEISTQHSYNIVDEPRNSFMDRDRI